MHSKVVPLADLPQQDCLPTFSPLLNFMLGGGLQLGLHTELAGPHPVISQAGRLISQSSLQNESKPVRVCYLSLKDILTKDMF
jgi:hypothetical protein